MGNGGSNKSVCETFGVIVEISKSWYCPDFSERIEPIINIGIKQELSNYSLELQSCPTIFASRIRVLLSMNVPSEMVCNIGYVDKNGWETLDDGVLETQKLILMSPGKEKPSKGFGFNRVQIIFF
jgi:hypothetical protein